MNLLLVLFFFISTTCCFGEREEDVKIDFVESIPVGVNLKTDMSTAEGWINLINSARSTLDMAAFYTTLTGGSEWPAVYGGANGTDVYNAIVAAAKRGVKVRLVENVPSAEMPDTDAINLQKDGYVDLRFINWTDLYASGILHTKLIVADAKSFYIGSANMDWRSLSMVKEFGAVVWSSAALGGDALRVFETYWLCAFYGGTPSHWPSYTFASYNASWPLFSRVDGEDASLYLAVSPPKLQAPHFTSDLEAIQKTLDDARSFVDMEVMDYAPATLYRADNFYWPEIDSHVRSAAFRGVNVRFLVGLWEHTDPYMMQYLFSLDALVNVSVQAVVIPQFNASGRGDPPFTRVNHAKWMLSDAKAFIDTSNWTGDYFTTTGGASLNIVSEPVRDKLRTIFERDWNSEYVFALDSPTVKNLVPPIP